MKLKKLKKGSFTIEAAGVMSVVMLAIIGILYLCFLVHNRNWLTAAAYEAAITGSMESVMEEGNAYETAVMKSRELGNTGFPGAENLKSQVQAGKEVKVTYTAETISGFGGFHWEMKAEGCAKVIQPAKWIRKTKAASEIVAEIGG